MTKEELRKDYLKYRKNYDSSYIKNQSDKIIKKISHDINFKKSKTVGIYFPILGEIDITELVKLYPEKKFCIPKICENEMIFTKYEIGDKLVCSKFNTKETIDCSEVVPDIIFCPLILANYENFRIGYGKGYYDRYFLKNNIKKKIGIAYNGSFSDFTPDSSDIKLDYIITPNTYKNALILLSAGSGNRARKIYKCIEKVNNKHIFEYSLDKFDEKYKKIVIVPSEKFFDVFKRPDVVYLIGDNMRYKSMLKAKKYLNGKYIYIHDGARPYLENEAITLLEEYEKNEKDIFYLCKRPVNTIRDKDNNLVNDLVICETPQVIKKELFDKLGNNLISDNFKDDISFFKSNFNNLEIGRVYHESNNYKLTYEEDLIDFKKNIYKKTLAGHSFDIHKISKKRPLYLGGIFIRNNYGLVANSDGDCIIHAITEAIFGALSKRDLGYYFPPNDEKYKNVSSLRFLDYGKKMLNDGNYSIINIDLLLYYDVYKLNDYFSKILDFLKKYLQTEQISLKATTAEKLGKIGKNKAIGCECNILVGERC